MAHGHGHQDEAPSIYGVIAEFETPEQILAAAEKVRLAGYTQTDAYSPFPIEHLAGALGKKPTRLPWIVLIAAICGGTGAFSFMTWTSTVFYPWNVGGRPYFSWPSFIPITFEGTILAAALTAVIAMLIANGLPMPYHPVFNVPGFGRASRDRFFLVIKAIDPKFNAAEAAVFLKSLHPLHVCEVPA